MSQLDLVRIDFTKMDPSRTGHENVLMIIDTFTKFFVAVVTINQKAITMPKLLVD